MSVLQSKKSAHQFFQKTESGLQTIFALSLAEAQSICYFIMINSAITEIVSRLNLYIKNRFHVNEDVVVISNILDFNGVQHDGTNNKVAVFVVKIEKDQFLCQGGTGAAIASNRPARYPPLHLNIYIMFAACFFGKSYPEALKFISNTIAFFQINPIFDHKNTPDLDQRIEKLHFSIENLSFNDLSSLWGVLSGKYVPSVMYKMRLLTFDADYIKHAVPVVRDADISAAKR